MTWVMMRDSHAPGNGKTEIWWESGDEHGNTSENQGVIELKEISALLLQAEEAMSLLDQVADILAREQQIDGTLRGENEGTRKLRTCSHNIHRLLDK